MLLTGGNGVGWMVILLFVDEQYEGELHSELPLGQVDR